MPSFQGSDKIDVQPGTSKAAYEFEFTVCSAAGANDGWLAYGRTISSVAVKAYKHGETEVDATSDLINGTPSVANNIVTVKLDYPTVNGSGRYKLEFVVTLDDGSDDEADFGRVFVRDL